jgi:predicted PhzF superfamily epimerase YddE/YHI9
MSTVAYEIVDVFTDRPFAGHPTVGAAVTAVRRELAGPGWACGSSRTAGCRATARRRTRSGRGAEIAVPPFIG